MKPNPSLNVILITLFSFAAYQLLSFNFKAIKLALDEITRQGFVSYILTYLMVGIPIFIGTFLIHRSIHVFASLGLSLKILPALLAALLFTLPMFMGGILFFKLNLQLEIQSLMAATIVAGFMEELYFRGFLFGQLFQKTTWGFVPSIIFGALLFASAHLHQSNDMGQLIGIFFVTFSGAIFFAWLFVEWKYNLWVPILTHTLMNLSWNIFAVDSNALGDLTANVFRGLTILIAILFTIFYKKRRNEPLIVNKETWWMKNQPSQ